ncbi:lamin tail domain-containing protein [Hymenobacter sp. HDW8]|uniref:lamin tail domain-containing protein n=1 Tax=Hymenobacter sp. HDW8 TaxID=2714932 RepID=UPI00140AFE05|nr:lamin tail domain-containing protein [Hymenobacter sp. HDW8]QIL76034.1 lamin tail domain-containing protein [Hymenobacter sp. HDW8]
MKSFLLSLFLIILTNSANAQLTESFTDGDFAQNPTWTGDEGSFQVNTQQLQSNGPTTTGTTLQLATPSTAASGVTWEFYVNLRLATSGGNLADVWLMADQANLKTTGTKGYFVRLGGTPDEISLFRQDATGSPVYVINGQDGTLKSSTSNTARVRVTRSPQNLWTLEYDLIGGQNFTLSGTATDATHQRSAYFGLRITYSSANSRNFYFDDFRITDTVPPALLSAAPTSPNQLDALFSEALNASPSAASYRLLTGPAVLAAQLDGANPALVHLTLGGNLPLGTNTLEARNVTDANGIVAAGPLTATFVNQGFAVLPAPNQVLITEIMVDETPVVGLPASEYVEIHNPMTGTVLDLAGLRLLKPGSTTAAVFPTGAVLLPGEYAIVCGSTRTSQFTAFGKVFGLTNFPSLSNAGDQLVLRGRNGQTLFEITYSDTWYKDLRKKEGGWSLEMVDPANPCAGGSNWTASTDDQGGTPGRANAVQATNPDRTPPTLLRAVALNSTTVRLFFGEKLDSLTSTNVGRYAITPAVPIVRATPQGPEFRTIDLLLATNLPPNQPLTVAVQQATDCAGNISGPITSATFALPVAAQTGEVVINEILFNPRTGGVDFVELLNRSAKYLDVQGWQLGVEQPTGSSASAISAGPYGLAPGQLVVLTTRPDIVQNDYPTHDPATFLAMPSFPSLPDDAATVVVLDAKGQTIERFSYSETQHLPLLSDRNGVSLERVRAAETSVGGNFHSAASAVGYATPGRPNSQYQADPTGAKLFQIAPEIFTPDEDGQQDFTTLTYRFEYPGYAASITVYDAQGRLTRRLARNETLPTSGYLQWDGLTDQGRKAAIGPYVLLIELYRVAGGETHVYKRNVVLGGRL